jgi:DNA-binding NtrC family response regulator
MSPRHILIADDDRHLRESLCEVMTDAGWSAVAAGCGKQAIEVLSHGHFDLLLSDVDMPDMTGFELLAWATSHRHPEPPANLTTVLMSARATPDLTSAALRSGAITLLPKPVRIAEITRLVSTLFPNS